LICPLYIDVKEIKGSNQQLIQFFSESLSLKMSMTSGFLILFLIGLAFADPIPISPKVVNGTDAQISEFPFMVSLRRNNGHSCGATILNDYWLLTAAHCVLSLPDNYTVQYANTVISREGSNVVKVAQFIPHEGYNASNQYIHDIALVRLEEPIVNELHDYKVRLPVSGSYFATGTPAVLSGYKTILNEEIFRMLT